MKKLRSIEEIISANMSATQTLARTPEPIPVMDQEESVKDYDKILKTNVAANYTFILDFIYRCLPDISKGLKALDLCSGPGLLALSQVNYFNIDELQGIDLSEPMVRVANKNAQRRGVQDRAKFKAVDLLEFLRDTKSGTFDLVTFDNSAHDMDSLEVVAEVLKEVDRVTKSDGLFVMNDVARLKSADITASFVQFMGMDFLSLNMPYLYEDLEDTMYAAWLPEEIATTIPQNSQRHWYHIVPQILPYCQVIIGSDRTDSELYLRDSKDWNKTELLDHPKKKASYQGLKDVFTSATQVKIDAKK